MIKIVLDAGYHGYIGIEWEGERPGEIEGTRLTQRLLERVRDKLSRA
jgi:L-ribulose-5-phosphate 3-epimerase